jgi:4-carboxymuconolactone decarboxylase
MRRLLFMLVIIAGVARAEDRLPPIPRERMTDAQRAAAERFAAGRGKPIYGPFVPLLRSPGLMLAAQAMGDHLRFQSPLPAAARELAILLTCRDWSQPWEWAVHVPLALDAGVRKDAIDAIGDGRRPYGLDEEQETAYAFVAELLHNRRVSDVTWRRAVQRFGEEGVVDLAGTAGYFSLVGAVLNAAQTPPPPGPALRRFSE